MGTRFRVTVMSGRFDAPLASVKAAFDRETSLHTSLIFTTEQGDKTRGTALDHRGYGLARCATEGRKAEQVVLYADTVWTPLDDARSLELTNGGGHNSQRFPIYATVQLLRHNATGRLVATIAVHMPSHLDKSSPFYYPVNLILWRRAVSVLSREVARLRKAYAYASPGLIVLIAGDWNARQTSGWTAAALVKALPGFRAGRGDLFGNVWACGVREFGPASTVQPQGSSDHVIHRFVYEFKEKP